MIRILSFTTQGKLHGFLEEVKLKVDELDMTQIFGSTLRIEADVGTLAVEVSAALLKLVILMCRAALLDCVEDVEAMVLVEFEGL